MFGRIGIPELILILFIALMIFGPAKLPEVGRSIGKALREFHKASSEFKESISLKEDKIKDKQSDGNEKVLKENDSEPAGN